jgi:uncharacterized membrane protein
MIRLCILTFITPAIIVSCSTGEKGQVQTSEELQPLPRIYNGFIPCASCPGIDYTLQIKSNLITEISYYLDRSENPIVKTASWKVHGDTLSISYRDERASKYYLISDSTLTLLNQDGERITGELADHYVLQRNFEAESIRERHRELKNMGVDFIATGNEPFWSVRLLTNDTLTFSTPQSSNTLSIKSRENAGNLQVYHAENDERSLTMTIEEKYCRDSMSGFLFTHIVKIDPVWSEGNELKGCGSVPGD